MTRPVNGVVEVVAASWREGGVHYTDIVGVEAVEATAEHEEYWLHNAESVAERRVFAPTDVDTNWDPVTMTTTTGTW